MSIVSKLNRRGFLKTSGLAVAATVASGKVNAEATPLGAPQAAETASEAPRSPVILVNLLQGTDSTYEFSRGNTLPIAARPFGMAHWTLQSRADSPWMFAPGERRLQGLRSTHQLSPWLGDYGQATFLPFCGKVNPEPGARGSSYRPEDAALHPHAMKLHLLRYGIDVVLLPTERCARMEASFSKPEAPGWMFDVPGPQAPTVEQDLAARTIRFTSSANEGGVPPGFACYYVLQFDQPWESFEMKALKGGHAGMVHFAPKAGAAEAHHVAVSVGTSFISFEQAERNLELELSSRSAEEIRREGEAVWNKHLRTLEIEGGTPVQQRTFYSCLYRTLLFPRMWHEPDASGAMQHRSAYNGKVVPGVMYADHGYWDVYRAWYPMMTLLFPERLGEILQAWVNAYKEGGWLPQFPCPGYRACMTGSLIDSVFGDAAAKGVKGFDLQAAFDGLKKHATVPGNPDAGYGRRGLEAYLKYGYAPAGLVSQSAAETVDAAYGDFCIAQVAKALGHDADTTTFLKRSESWKHLFDPGSKFFRGKKADGQWTEPFDPNTWGDPYVEGSAWQHRFDVPHDVDGLIAAMGGKTQAAAALEDMIAREPDFNVGVYGQEIHEMSEMAAVHFGQYAHGNQPVHHMLYLLAHADRPDRTRFWVHRVLNELYSPEMFAGDEDTGSMAAWYVLSALGIYAVCPGKPEYTLGHALFARATVHLPGDKTLHVEAVPLEAAKGEASFNGKRVTGVTLTHKELRAGGRLQFG